MQDVTQAYKSSLPLLPVPSLPLGQQEHLAGVLQTSYYPKFDCHATVHFIQWKSQ